MKEKKLNNIYLIGPMGSGKTTVGKSLAALTRKTLYDSDHEIERTTGVDISWIFEVEGEAGFRKREETVIAQLTQMNHIILSTGGGAVLASNNRQHLAQNGVVIYLQVSVNKQLKRTLNPTHFLIRHFPLFPHPVMPRSKASIDDWIGGGSRNR